jgi:uncharacterized protein (TIGR03083 family)
VSLWRRPGFTPLLTSATVSEAGSQVTALVLPVLAATVLAATPWQMGVLAACTTAAFLVVGLPAGALVDRWRPRRVMVVCDVVRGALLVTVPVVAWAGALTLTQLVVVALGVGTATVFADVSSQSMLPALVGRDELVRANSLLMTGASAAEVSGPGLGGLLLRIVSAPVALLADVVSFLVSAVLLTAVPAPPRPARSGRRALLAEIAEGLRYVVGHPVIRRVTLCTAGLNLASGARDAVIVLFALRTLGLSPSTWGVVVSIGAVGGVLGALSSGRLADLVGQGRIVPLAALIEVPSVALTPLARGAVLLAVSAAGASFSAVAYNVAQVSMRQRSCPPELLGRMNASIRTLVWGTPPVGALVGGGLAGVLGLVPVLWIAVAVTLVAVVPVVLSPLLRDEVPAPEPGTGAGVDEISPVDEIEEWSRAQARVIALMEGASEDQVASTVPACPAWTARDLFSHMVGLGTDVVAGDEPDDHHADWTAKQVRERADRTVAQLVDEWRATAEPLRAWMVQHGSRPLGDVIIHEQDLRGALGVPGGQDSDGVAAIRDRFAPRVGGRLPSGTTLGLVGESWSWASDDGDPEAADVVLAAPDFELARALLARRSAGQIRSWVRRGDVEPVLDAFATLGPLPDDERHE